MNPKRLFATWGIMTIAAVILNLAILGGAVWVVVKVLKWTGVL